MKKNKWFTQPLSIIVLLALCTLISACKKFRDKDTQAASDNAQSEFASEDIENISEAAQGGTTSFKTSSVELEYDILGGCATVNKDTSEDTNADTLTIDFGASNCLCRDNRYRRGIITIIYFGNKLTAGSFRNVTFTNFFVEDHQIEGSHTVTANGLNTSGNYFWSISAKNMKITRPDGKSHSWSSERTREMKSGISTPLYRQDDIFYITGSGDGTNINGVKYHAEITGGLTKEVSCKWIVSGIIVVTHGKKAPRTLDFGAGLCDDDATVTIKGQTYPIKLK